MSLYVPPAFGGDGREVLARLAQESPFATVITPGGTEPFVTHVPLDLERDGETDVLVGHFARANPHCAALVRAPTVAIFHGPHAYVSPSWYERPAAAVPTWNYVVAHAHGEALIDDDPEGKRAVVERLTARFEGARERPWSLALQGEALERMLAAIVAFRLPVRRLEVKLKLSQNRGAADREGVARALAAEASPEARAVARWMHAHAGA